MNAEGHRPVLREAVVRLFAEAPTGTIVDGTVGLGGHAEAILEARGDMGLLGLDRDREALSLAKERLTRFGDRVDLRSGNYAELRTHLSRRGSEGIVGLLLDLGVSSLQLDDPQRGFGFRHDGPLDMRMDPERGIPASEWIATAEQTEIADVLRRFGEERYADRIARAIVEARLRGPIDRTRTLRDVVHGAVPRTYFAGPIDPATRTFQAIRIRVNGELDNLQTGLAAGFEALAPDGVMVVISFHSLEDRMVKAFFREKAASCVCPPELPECVCDKSVEAEILTQRPIRPGEDEIAENPRSRSARLRAARKVGSLPT
jgi:16S rRNA (cytosine1402-N4)-methyltransferase